MAEQAEILKIPIKPVYTHKDVAGMDVEEQLAKTGCHRRIDYYQGDIEKLEGMGVAAVFGPSSTDAKIIETINRIAQTRGVTGIALGTRFGEMIHFQLRADC